MTSEDQRSVPKEGGWGYVIVAATVVIVGTTVVSDLSLNENEYNFFYKKSQMSAINESHVFMNDTNLIINIFNFTPGDILVELVNAMINTFLCGYFGTISYGFSGILACFLLMKFSYRKVSFLGSVIFLVGAISRIFIQNFTQVILHNSFNAIPGLGVGLLMSACLATLNLNFVKKIAPMTCLHETAVYAFGLVIPQLSIWSAKTFGPRETLIGFSLLRCLCLPASALLKPLPKLKIVRREKQNEDPLMDMMSLAKPKESVIPLTISGRIVSKTTFSRLSEKLTLLNSYKYWNTVIGISLAINADECFFTLIPMLNQTINADQKSEFPLEHYSAPELIFRIVLTIVSAFVKLNSRMLILSTSALVVVIRVVLVSYIDPKSQLVLFECLKCFTQAPVPLVFSEEYKDNFTTAYCIFMVMYSVVSLIFGGLIHAALHCIDGVKKTEYICIAAYAICVIIWTLEFTIFRKKPTNNDQNLNENQ